jgi:hypothetical protein
VPVPGKPYHKIFPVLLELFFEILLGMSRNFPENSQRKNQKNFFVLPVFQESPQKNRKIFPDLSGNFSLKKTGRKFFKNFSGNNRADPSTGEYTPTPVHCRRALTLLQLQD